MTHFHFKFLALDLNKVIDSRPYNKGLSCLPDLNPKTGMFMELSRKMRISSLLRFQWYFLLKVQILSCIELVAVFQGDPSLNLPLAAVFETAIL